MANGFKTGGRQKGSRNRKTAELQEKVAAEGVTPLDYMLEVLRDGNQTLDVRLEAAKSAAPYVHAKLAAMEVTGAEGGPVEHTFKWSQS